MKCQICGEELSFSNIVDPFATIICCDKHKKYQFHHQLGICRALEGFNDDPQTYTEEFLAQVRKGMEGAHALHYRNFTNWFNEKRRTADEVMAWVKTHIPYDFFGEIPNMQEVFWTPEKVIQSMRD